MIPIGGPFQEFSSGDPCSGFLQRCPLQVDPTKGSAPGGPIQVVPPFNALHGVQTRSPPVSPLQGVPTRWSPIGCHQQGVSSRGSHRGFHQCFPSTESPRDPPRKLHIRGHPEGVPSRGSLPFVAMQGLHSRGSPSGSPPHGSHKGTPPSGSHQGDHTRGVTSMGKNQCSHKILQRFPPGVPLKWFPTMGFHSGVLLYGAITRGSQTGGPFQGFPPGIPLHGVPTSGHIHEAPSRG